jgi:WhiB family redox-sensing transcriptional regulator
VARAKAVCDGCDVRAACLEWSLATYQDAGVWGGLDEEERREIRRARRRAAGTGALSSVG